MCVPLPCVWRADLPLWPFLGRFDSSLRGRLFPGKASNLTWRRGRHTEMVRPGASASFASRGSGCTSEGWPLGLRGLPPRGGGGSPAGPLANPRFASAGRLRTHGSSVGSSLPPPVPYPGSVCLEISSWSSVFSPPKADERPDAALGPISSLLSRCGRLSSQRLQHLQTLEGPRAARWVEPGALDHVSCRVHPWCSRGSRTDLDPGSRCIPSEPGRWIPVASGRVCPRGRAAAVCQGSCPVSELRWTQQQLLHFTNGENRHS